MKRLLASAVVLAALMLVLGGVLVTTGAFAGAKQTAVPEVAQICRIHDDTAGRNITILWPATQATPTTSYGVGAGPRDFDWQGKGACGARYVSWLWLSGEVHPVFTYGSH